MSSTDQFSWGLFWEELLLDREANKVALHFGFLEGRPTLHPNLPSVVFPLLACYILVCCGKIFGASLTDSYWSGEVLVGSIRPPTVGGGGYWWARSDPLPLVVVGAGEYVPTPCPGYLFIQWQHCHFYPLCSAEYRWVRSDPLLRLASSSSSSLLESRLRH